MKTKFYFLLLACALTACDVIDDSESELAPERTVLVYMPGENNLSREVTENINAMLECLAGTKYERNLIAFADQRDAAPCMLRITPSGIDTLDVFENVSLVDASTLSMAIEYVKKNCRNKSYGLVLWGHGTGWIPLSQLHNVARNLGYAPMRSATRSYALEYSTGKNRVMHSIDLDSIITAIPDGMFDFIAFDACYMANVEVAYALRKKADYILASCAEVAGSGYPYSTITNHLIENNLTKVCSGFMDYYNSREGREQMGDISLIHTAGLDSLAGCYRKIIAEYRNAIPDMDVTDIQYFDGFDKHTYYDIEDFLEKLGTRVEYMDEFKSQMKKTVFYHSSTPFMFPGEYNELEIKKHSGMSVYIPISKYESIGLNQEYTKTEWYKATY